MHDLMTQPQEWWPADWGHYGGLMIEWLGMLLERIEQVTEEVEQEQEIKICSSKFMA